MFVFKSRSTWHLRWEHNLYCERQVQCTSGGNNECMSVYNGANIFVLKTTLVLKIIVQKDLGLWQTRVTLRLAHKSIQSACQIYNTFVLSTESLLSETLFNYLFFNPLCAAKVCRAFCGNYTNTATKFTFFWRMYNTRITSEKSIRISKKHLFCLRDETSFNDGTKRMSSSTHFVNRNVTLQEMIHFLR